MAQVNWNYPGVVAALSAAVAALVVAFRQGPYSTKKEKFSPQITQETKGEKKSRCGQPWLGRREYSACTHTTHPRHKIMVWIVILLFIGLACQNSTTDQQTYS